MIDHGQAQAREPLASSAQRVLVIGGLLLISSGMLLGDIFAMFVLHPNNARIGEAMYAAAQLIPTGDVDGIMAHFMAMEGFLENRGTKIDAHSHAIHMGYIALLLAMIQPWVALSETVKQRTAWLFIIAAILLPISIFAIRYVGLAFSPFDMLGWASILADFFGVVLALVMFIEFWGVWRYTRGHGQSLLQPIYIGASNRASRTLLVGGLLLLASGFVYGAAMAAWKQMGLTVAELDILKNIVSHASASQSELVNQDFGALGQYQLYRGINIAAHTHINEMGIALLLMSFLQVFVQYCDRTRQRWAQVAVCSSFAMPIGILLEIPYGIVGSIIADSAGFLMIASMLAMLFGLLRYTGASDAGKGGVA
ncbi:MAG: hypothetical protein V3T17_10180 [Pseudomonadales bacterium]